jgi:hypothetical protein
MAMVAITTDVALKSEEVSKPKKGGWFELALAMHLAAGRFSSPAGIVFVQQNYLPLLLQKRG